MPYRPIRLLFALLAPARLLIPLSIAALLAALVVGCATFNNTPRQEYTWAMWENCKQSLVLSSGLTVNRVESDGRWWTSAVIGPAESDLPKLRECMNAQYKANPYLGWLKARQASAQPNSVATATATGAPVMANTTLPGTVTVPVWHVGDEWQYAYQGPTDSGTYVWVVNRVETLDGVEHYVVKGGARELFYRVSDLASSLERVDGVIVNRNTPARLSYVWPLTVGKVWDQDFRNELPVDRQTTTRNSTWTVGAEETVTVPAGTFRTLKITWRNRNTSALLYDMWYAPDVKQWVKIREVLSNGIREREMVSFKLK
jgi:hypothetical protein